MTQSGITHVVLQFVSFEDEGLVFQKWKFQHQVSGADAIVWASHRNNFHVCISQFGKVCDRAAHIQCGS